ncbi:hypothetical protein IJM86_00625 [bacterium]|nr:hypothetical protein [bacterium]
MQKVFRKNLIKLGCNRTFDDIAQTFKDKESPLCQLSIAIFYCMVYQSVFRWNLGTYESELKIQREQYLQQIKDEKSE